MKTLSTYSKVLLGKNNNENIYLTPPSWNCGWYWGFGYLGNKNCHYHVDGLKKIEIYNAEKGVWKYEFVNLKDGFDRHFEDTFIIRESDRWVFAELFSTFYKLRETAEMLGRGGSHLTTNPIADLIKNTDEVKRINEVIMPQLFDEIYKVINRNQDNEEHYKAIIKMVLSGSLNSVVSYLFENNFNFLFIGDFKDNQTREICSHRLWDFFVCLGDHKQTGAIMTVVTVELFKGIILFAAKQT